MHLKKGDVVAIIATVVEEHSAKVEVTISGTEFDGQLVVPGRVLRLLERAAYPGDKVVLPDKRKGTFFQLLNENVAIVLLDDSDESDPASYINVARENLRNQDQNDAFQFAPRRKVVLGAENGRDILEADSAQSKIQDPETSQSVVVKEDESSANSDNVQEAPDQTATDSAAPDGDRSEVRDEAPVSNDLPGETAEAAALEERVVITLEAPEASQPADEITVEMPDAPLPKRQGVVVSETEDASEEAAAQADTASDNIVDQSSDTAVPSFEETAPENSEDEGSAGKNAAADEAANDEVAAAPTDTAVTESATAQNVVIQDKNEGATPEASTGNESAADGSSLPTESKAAEEAPIHDPERKAHLESMKKGILEDLREQEGQSSEGEDGDIFSSIDNLDKRMA